MCSSCCMTKKQKAAVIEEERIIIVEGDTPRIFRIFDRNNDGTISAEEIYKAFKKLKFPITEEDVQDIMQEFDADHNNNIDYEEFKYFVQHFLKAYDKPFEYFFHYFDSDDDGEICLEEFMSALNVIGRDDISIEEATEILEPYYNERRKLNLEEFGKAFMEILEGMSSSLD